jgi:hypothetical protein
LWQRPKKQGLSRSSRIVTEWASRRRRAEKTDGALSRPLSSQTIEQPIPIGRDGDPMVVEACTIIAVF